MCLACETIPSILKHSILKPWQRLTDNTFCVIFGRGDWLVSL